MKRAAWLPFAGFEPMMPAPPATIGAHERVYAGGRFNAFRIEPGYLVYPGSGMGGRTVTTVSPSPTRLSTRAITATTPPARGR